MCKINVVILTPETAATVVFEQWPMPVGRIFYPGRSKKNAKGPSDLLEKASFCRCCCLGIAPRNQLPMKSAWLLHLIGDKAPPAARDSNEAARAYNKADVFFIPEMASTISV